MPRIKAATSLLLFLLSTKGIASQDEVSLSVWVNEAIVATYTYTDQNFLERQKNIAHYFTGQAWTAYNAALLASKVPEMVKKNAYQVTAVAALPPEIKNIQANQWEASMPLFVSYKNPQYQQRQDLLVTITFAQAPQGQGIRGLAITSFQASLKAPPCTCTATSTTDKSLK